MGSHTITCHAPPDTSEHTPPKPQLDRQVLNLPTLEGWKAELNSQTTDHKSDALTTTPALVSTIYHHVYSCIVNKVEYV